MIIIRIITKRIIKKIIMSIKNLDALKNYFCYAIILITVLYHRYNTVITHKVFLPFVYELYTTRIKKMIVHAPQNLSTFQMRGKSILVGSCEFFKYLKNKLHAVLKFYTLPISSRIVDTVVLGLSAGHHQQC